MELVKAELIDFHQLELEFSDPIPFVGINIPNYTIMKIVPKQDSRKHLVEVHEEFDLSQEVAVFWNNQKKIASVTKIAGSSEFERKFRYQGSLGVEVTEELTIFRIWAPTAIDVNLQLYPDESPDTPVAKIYKMSRNVEGVWALSLSGNTEGLVYDYGLVFPGGKTVNSYDPYAKACIVNGRRSVVVSEGRLQEYVFKYPRINNGLAHDSEVLMLHTHIKSLTEHETSGLHKRLRGKYLGLIEPGTKTKDGQVTGLDYLLQNKPSHLRLMPIVDFGSIDEKRNDGYSYGYDPVNFNIPEGSYASDPYNPLCRIIEVKKMIDGLHQRKIKVILDMMYMQIYNPKQHVLNYCVPGYYFRLNDKGEETNELAVEKFMAKRCILDSVKYWLSEYHIDGICFESGNACDIETMRRIREIADEIDPNIMIIIDRTLGKTHISNDKASTLRNADSLFGVNFINYSLESWLDHYPNTELEDSEKLMANMLGEFYDFQHINMLSLDQIIQSLRFLPKPDTIHDDTLWYKFILSIYFLSQGAISLNMYEIMNQGSELSFIDWDKVTKYQGVQEYMQQLIEFRQKHSVFALSNYADIHSKKHQIHLDTDVLAYSLMDEDITYLVVVNTTAQAKKVSLPTGKYNILIDNGQVAKYPHSIDLRDELMISPLDVMLLSRK